MCLSDAQLRKLDVPGPRYTSNPTANPTSNRFAEAFGATEYAQAPRQRAEVLSGDELDQLLGHLRASFKLLPHTKLSIEVDRRTATGVRLHKLATLGFNRISFGIQDFAPAVQAAVHRMQPDEQVAELMSEAKALPLDLINIDLIYGLPKQSPALFARKIDQVAVAKPARIALYAYAHLPERFKPQRRIDGTRLPTGDGLVRCALIMALMCQGRVAFESAEMSHLIKFCHYFQGELVRLQELDDLGLVGLTEQELQVMATGWVLVRAVAMIFDRHLQADQLRVRFSRII